MVRLFTLGGLALERDGQLLDGIANRKVLLALLALVAAERGIGRDKLVAYLWPDSDESRGRNNLKQSLFGLRRELGAPVVVSSGGTLRLDPAAVSCDLADFEAAVAAGDLATAAELYRGPFLDGFYLAERSELEHWMEGERYRLHRMYSEVLRGLGNEAETEGDSAGAVRWWRLAAATEPYSAPVALGAMRALVAAGDRAGALEHARLYQSALRDEMGLPPEPSVSQFAESLRAASPHGPRLTGGQEEATPLSPSLLLPALADGPIAVPAAPRRLRFGWLTLVIPVLAALAVAVAVQVFRGSRSVPAV
ncbi:MAG TPA: BTAD domain-containing putative transcriptional regulator, partial [Gemmatimonadales bacterium]|nr:BTAD domain-containing putative transcriptional regulator [Gemmatimonadales bacterium]